VSILIVDYELPIVCYSKSRHYLVTIWVNPLKGEGCVRQQFFILFMDFAKSRIKKGAAHNLKVYTTHWCALSPLSRREREAENARPRDNRLLYCSLITILRLSGCVACVARARGEQIFW
jgi:hypothetical protein